MWFEPLRKFHESILHGFTWTSIYRSCVYRSDITRVVYPSSVKVLFGNYNSYSLFFLQLTNSVNVFTMRLITPILIFVSAKKSCRDRPYISIRKSAIKSKQIRLRLVQYRFPWSVSLPLDIVLSIINFSEVLYSTNPFAWYLSARVFYRPQSCGLGANCSAENKMLSFHKAHTNIDSERMEQVCYTRKYMCLNV